MYLTEGPVLDRTMKRATKLREAPNAASSGVIDLPDHMTEAAVLAVDPPASRDPHSFPSPVGAFVFLRVTPGPTTTSTRSPTRYTSRQMVQDSQGLV